MERIRLGRPARWAAVLSLLLLLSGAVVAAVRHDGGASDSSGSAPATTGAFPLVDDRASADRDQANESAGPANASAGAGGGRSALAPSAGTVAPDGPKIVKTAELRVKLDEKGFRAAFDKATSLATSHGGFVVSSNSRTENGRVAAGSLVLRVPAASFDKVRSALAELGEVDSEVVSGEDVGGQLVDIDARLRSLAVEEETLRTLMARAKTVGETIEVQQQLTRVRQEIEQLNGQRARLADAVALSTVTVDLFESGVSPADPGEPNPIAEGARDAVEASAEVLGGTLVVLGYTLPLALLALIAWGLWRLVARRRTTALSST